MMNRQALNHPRRGAVLLAALAVALAYAGTAQAAGSYAYDAAKGKQLFTSTCAACHQVSGEGIPSAFPPLKGNAVVNAADPTAHLHTILFGAHGLIVGGVKYASAMPPFGTLQLAYQRGTAEFGRRSDQGNTLFVKATTVF